MHSSKPRMRTLIILASLLCFVVGSLLISCDGSAGTPESTISDFFNAIKHGDGKFAFKQYVENGEEILAKVWNDEWDEFDKWQKKMKDISFEISDVQAEENEAVVTVRILDKDGRELDTDEMEMKLIDGKWKISAEVFD